MNLAESTQFFIKEVAIQSKGGPIALNNMVEEIHLYDNLFLPVSSGEILVTDTKKLIERIDIKNDAIQFYICKSPEDSLATYKKAFRIYSISHRKNLNNSSESYIIHFVDDELIYSEQKKVSMSFDGKYSKLVEKILTDKRMGLGLDLNKISRIEESSGIRNINVNNLSPFSAIEWCAKRALNPKEIPDFLFFSNRAGYNFSSLSRLLTNESILDITFSPKNLEPNQAFSELSRARGFEVVSQFDSISRIKSGVDAGVFIGFDPITRTLGEQPISGDKTYDSMAHGNKNAQGSEIINRDGTSNKTNWNSNQVLSVNTKNQKNSKYQKKRDPTSISKNETTELFTQQRRAILARLMERRLKIVMPGNFQLSSGYNVNVIAPGFGEQLKNGDVNFDRSLGGKYIIIGTRHILSLRRHVTIIEVATDSTNDDRKLATTQTQKEVLQKYDQPINTI
jgi:hypothetical protein